MLPVRLPENINLNTKGNPRFSRKWKEVIIDGEKMTRETDTLDTFVCSSGIILDFVHPQRKITDLTKTDINYWMPVDQYIGGVEHAILHLLYSRFFMKALKYEDEDLKLANL